MPLLADLQADVRRAVTLGDAHLVRPRLVGGADPTRRFAIHQRHYQASLVTALCDKFPATSWLAGPDVVAGAASAYVRAHPPERPCIAEYGEDFPASLARHGQATSLPYLQSFAELEWAVGQVSIAIDRTPMTWSDIAHVGSEPLLSACVVLQPGLRYVRAPWALDRLMTTYLSGSAPETFVLAHADTCIEIRGARGALQLQSIDPATFAFRTALLGGRPLGDAAWEALDCDPAWDAGQAVRDLAAAGLVTEVAFVTKGQG